MAARTKRGRLDRMMRAVLRHCPPRFALTPDQHGFLSMAALVQALRTDLPSVCNDEVVSIAREEHERFEFVAGRVRARYGHSERVPVERESTPPPLWLYHAAPAAAAATVLEEGLRPMRRTHVHLTTDRGYARSAAVGEARPVLLVVDATRAHGAGVRFYEATARVWLSDPVPAEFVALAAAEAPGDSAARIRAIFESLADDEP